mmetsp:Transcript_29657/g.100831  ORF Transcript_29657/g.100831 Transcript_29657/m.100831 type:complete len:236 (-) Transcript_29657:710-1417(-)
MTRTQPLARSSRACVFSSDWPSAEPTKSGGVARTTSPTDSSPISARIFPYKPATVVLPVPGLPRKTRFSATCCKGSSNSSRSTFDACSSSSSSTDDLTLHRPSMARSARSGSDSEWSSVRLPSRSSRSKRKMSGSSPLFRAATTRADCFSDALSSSCAAARALPKPGVPRPLPRRRAAILRCLSSATAYFGNRSSKRLLVISTSSSSLKSSKATSRRKRLRSPGDDASICSMSLS